MVETIAESVENLHVGELKKTASRLLFGCSIEQDFRSVRTHSIVVRIEHSPNGDASFEIKWKGDLHLGIIDAFDQNIRRGQDVLSCRTVKQLVLHERSLPAGNGLERLVV